MSLRELARVDRSRRASEFASYAHVLMASQATRTPLLRCAEELRAPASVVQCFKADQVGATTSNPSYAGALSEYEAMASGFLASLATTTVFDALLSDMQPGGRLHSQFGIVTADATAYVHVEGGAKPISKLTTASGTLAERKVAALVTASADLLRFAPGATELIGRSLRASVGSVTDKTFVDALVTLATPAVTGSGTDASGVFNDLRAVLDLVEVGDDSRLHIVMSPTVAKFLTLLATSSGALAAPAMSPTGGTLANMPVHISSHAGNNLLAIDASALVGVAEAIRLRTSMAASIEMADNPGASISSGSPEAPVAATGQVISMFDTDSVAVLCERTFGWSVLRSTGIAALDVTAWPTAGSPLV